MAISISNLDEVSSYLKYISQDNTVVFTNGNGSYITTLIPNLIKSYSGPRKLGIFCSDKDAVEGTCKVDIPGLKVSDLFERRCSQDYTRLCFVKIVIIHYALSLGYRVLYIDPDMAFKYQVLENLLDQKYAINYVFDNNGIVRGQRVMEKIDSVFCGSITSTGQIYLNSNLVLAYPTEYNLSVYKLDTTSLNAVLTIAGGSDEDFLNRIGRPSDHISFWDPTLFPSGPDCIKLNLREEALMIHANGVAGIEHKIRLLRKLGGWFCDQLLYTTTLATWQQTYKPEVELIVQASVVDGSDSLTSAPIGHGWKYVYQKGNARKCQIGTHQNLVMCCFDANTDKRRRGRSDINRLAFEGTLKSNGIANELIPHESYFASMPTYKFAICPEGNGIDTHRLYEALMAGCIPIVEENADIRQKYGDCPILWTTDYSEITHAYLKEKYAEMLQKTWNFSKLFLSFYDEEAIVIQQRGNFWTQRLTGQKWYENYLLF